MDNLGRFTRNMKEHVIGEPCGSRHYIKECIVKALEDPVLVYLPYPGGLSNFLTFFGESFNRAACPRSKLIVAVEDSCFGQKMEAYMTSFGRLIGSPNDIFSSDGEKIHVLSYSSLKTFQNAYEVNADEGRGLAIIFDDLSSIRSFLEITRILDRLLRKAVIRVALTSSPFMFLDYFQAKDTCKLFSCYTPVLHDKETSAYYKRIVETAEIVYYRGWRDEVGGSTPGGSLHILRLLDSTGENELKNVLRFLLKNDVYDSEYIRQIQHSYPAGETAEVRSLDFTSERLDAFYRILGMQTGQSTCVLFKDEVIMELVHDIVLKKIVAVDEKALRTCKKAGLRGIGSLHALGRLGNAEAILNLTFLCWNSLGTEMAGFDELIFFDYLPIYSARKRYILAASEMRGFFEALLRAERRIELEIKPLLSHPTELVEIRSSETAQATEYRILGGMKNISRINQMASMRNNIIRKVVQKGDDVILTVDSTRSCSSISTQLSRVLGAPVCTRRMQLLSSEVCLCISTIEFGVVSSLRSFVNPHLLTGLGFCDFRKNGFVLYMFSRDSNTRIKAEEYDLDGYIICENKNGVVDVYFTLKNYPMIFCSKPTNKIAKTVKKLKNMGHTDRQAFFDNIEWRRCSIKEAPFVRERYDIKIEVDLNRDYNRGILRGFYERRSGKAEERDPSRSKADGQKPSPAEDLFPSQGSAEERQGNPLDSFDIFLSIFGRYREATLVFSSVKKSSFTKLSCEDIRRHFHGIDFSEFYYYLCLLTKKGRYISNQLSKEDLERMSQFRARELCLYIHSRLGRRFVDVSSLVSGFGDGVVSPPPSGIEIRSATVTPLSFVFNFPNPLELNRVLREFDPDKFLRIGLREENMRDKVRQQSARNYDDVYNFFRDLLCDGLFLGRRKYFFLAMTTSQMKLHSTWFVTPYFLGDVLVGPDYIRSWLGDFSEIKNIGKYATRLGQAFGSTDEVLKAVEYAEVDDIERNGYEFTDGIGLISYALAKKASASLGLREVPSAFQVRLGGYKGVVAVHPWLDDACAGRLDPEDARMRDYIAANRSKLLDNRAMAQLRAAAGDAQLIFRRSMKKFNSSHAALEVVASAMSTPFYLNRQVILILEALGVEESVFIILQDQAIGSFLHEMANDLPELIRRHSSPLPSKVISSDYCFYRKFIAPIANKLTRDLCKKSKIFVPRGRSLMGVLDELAVLEEDEVFVMVKREKTDLPGGYNSYKDYIVITSKVVVAKNPCLHPGDVRTVTCVDRPELHYLKNVLVFSQKGHRPVPNMCSGSDLDGDIYLVSWDERLFPKRLHEPDSYASGVFLNKEIVSMTDIVNFYIRYIRSFHLGLIANSHLAISDAKGILSPDALRLALLFNKCVDFPKTGFLARVSDSLIPERYPDFMECKYNSYASEKILGKLHRRSACLALVPFPSCECPRCLEKHVLVFPPATRLIVRGSHVESRMVAGDVAWRDVSDESSLYSRYKSDMYAIMAKHNFRTEEDAFLGICEEGSDATPAFQDLKSIMNRYRSLTRDLKDQLLYWYNASSACDEKINSFIWNFPNVSDVRKYRKTQVLFHDTASGNFVFNRNIMLMGKSMDAPRDEDFGALMSKRKGDDTENVKRAQVKDPMDESDEKFHRSKLFRRLMPLFTGRRQTHRLGAVHAGLVKIKCNMTRYEEFKKRFTDPARLFYSEAFNLLFIMGFFDLQSFDDVFDFFDLLFLIVSEHSRYGIAKSILTISSMVAKQSAGHNPNIELASNRLLHAAFLLCLDISLVYKASAALRPLKTEKGGRLRSKKVFARPKPNEVIIMGMFDANDEMRLEEYTGPSIAMHGIDGLFTPALMNKGICRIESYRDMCYQFVQAVFESECLGLDAELLKRRLLIAQVVPGSFYLHSVPRSHTTRTMTIEEFNEILSINKRAAEENAGVGFFLYNQHPLLEKGTREEYLNRIGIRFDKKIEDYTLTLVFGDNRYEIGLDESFGVRSVTRGRKIIGKLFLLHTEAKDVVIEIVSEEVLYEEGYSALSEREKAFVIDDLVSIGNGEIHINEKVGKYSSARMEVDICIGIVDGYPIRLSNKQVYTCADGSTSLKLHQNRVFVSTLADIRGDEMRSVEKLERYFETLWGSIVKYYS
jgi:hypothetical protein